MNAQKGKNVNNKFSLYNLSNRKKEHLMDFTIENRLTCLNTKFQKIKGKLWTYIYSNNVKTQIDYILMNKKLINSALNYDPYSSFKGVSSEFSRQKYVWAYAGMRRKLKLHTMLNNRDIRDKYTITLRNKFGALQEILEHLLRMTNMRTSSMST